jgi:hypothetical protein
LPVTARCRLYYIVARDCPGFQSVSSPRSRSRRAPSGPTASHQSPPSRASPPRQTSNTNSRGRCNSPMPMLRRDRIPHEYSPARAHPRLGRGPGISRAATSAPGLSRKWSHRDRASERLPLHSGHAADQDSGARVWANPEAPRRTGRPDRDDRKVANAVAGHPVARGTNAIVRRGVLSARCRGGRHHAQDARRGVRAGLAHAPRRDTIAGALRAPHRRAHQESNGGV